MLDVVEADGTAARDVAAALEELAGARLPHRGEGVLVHDRVERERVVGVQPVGQPVVLRREAVRMALGTRRPELRDEIVQQVRRSPEAAVVDLAFGGHHLGEERDQSA